MADVVLQNVINTVQVQNETGENSKELPIGALASNVAFGGLQSTVSVEAKLKEHNNFIENLSTDNVKYTKNEVTQTLTEYLEKNITTDNKSTGIEEQEENDDSAYVTAKGVIDYLASKTNTEIKSTAEVANNNLVTDNAVYNYVKTVENKLPVAAETLDETENAKYVTVELFNSKYISMFEGELADDTTDTTTLVNPNQVVTYVKSKVETGEIEEGSNKLVTSGTLYTKFLDMPSLLETSIASAGHTVSDKIYVNAAQVSTYVTNEIAAKIPIVATGLNDNSQEGGYYTTPSLVASYVLSKYVGTVSEVEEDILVGEETETVIKRVVTLTNLKDIIPEDESTLDINDIYFKGFVTPKQVVDYVALQSHNVDTALRKYIGITGTVAENGNLLPEMGEGVTILSRLAALEEAVKLNTTTTN